MVGQLKIETTTDKKLLTEFMTNKRLFNTAMPDEDIKALEAGKWKPSMSGVYYVVYREEVPICVIRTHEVSNITLDIHSMLCPTQWGLGIYDQVQALLEEYLKKNTAYCKLLVQTPQCCRNVLQTAVRVGFELEGILTSAISWRGNIENLVLLTKNIRK